MWNRWKGLDLAVWIPKVKALSPDLDDLLPELEARAKRFQEQQEEERKVKEEKRKRISKESILRADEEHFKRLTCPWMGEWWWNESWQCFQVAAIGGVKQGDRMLWLGFPIEETESRKPEKVRQEVKVDLLSAVETRLGEEEDLEEVEDWSQPSQRVYGFKKIGDQGKIREDTYIGGPGWMNWKGKDWKRWVEKREKDIRQGIRSIIRSLEKSGR
jgi:hypothetical protein